MALMKFRESNQVKWVGVRPGHNGTQIIKYGLANNSTVVLHTVSAGKTLYLYSFNIDVYTTTASFGGQLRVRDTTPAIVNILADLNAGANMSQAIAQDLYYPIEIPAGYTIEIVSDVEAVIVVACIFGWEE